MCPVRCVWNYILRSVPSSGKAISQIIQQQQQNKKKTKRKNWIEIYFQETEILFVYIMIIIIVVVVVIIGVCNVYTDTAAIYTDIAGEHLLINTHNYWSGEDKCTVVK